jgi:hypothetical protein
MAKAKAKKKTTRKAPVKKKQMEVLLVGSKVKQAIKDADCNTGGPNEKDVGAIDGLNTWVHWLIGQATTRAKANGRRTVRGHDFMAPM